MAFGTRIEELHYLIRDAEDQLRWALDEKNQTGMPVVTPQGMQETAEAARTRRAAYQKELTARELMLVGGDWTFGGADERDPHPTKRKGTGMDRLHRQFYIAENGELPELPSAGDPGGVLNRYSMSRYFEQGDVAQIVFDPTLSDIEKRERMLPKLIRLDRLTTKEDTLRASLKKRA